MRTAARTAIATAVLAGALLSAGGTALAAVPQGAAHTSVTAVSAGTPVDDRHSGTPVSIAPGLIAVLRYKGEGPEAWIRAVSPDWKPGDDYMGFVKAVLDDKHRSATVGGLELELVEGGEIHVQNLVVTKDGKSTSYPLPMGQGSECVSGPVSQSIGAGALARLMMTPNGPIVQVEFEEEGDEHTRLTRTNPSLPEGAAVVARILNPSSAEPVFEWNQGGGTGYGHATFPELRKGCTLHYTLQKPTEQPQPEHAPAPKPSATPSTAPTTAATPTAADPKPQTAGQTSVVPKGSVAAGAELAADDSTTSTTALGAALAATLAAGLGSAFLLRRRARTQR
ncbi:hypothetical protein ACFXDJ_35345 [Streptomyces sp. NPDC059443]|uniref:hypothetical protein n=1 Tax=unclassified Streptomyces TaxID=2593676 RepID=UPI0036AEAF96